MLNVVTGYRIRIESMVLDNNSKPSPSKVYPHELATVLSVIAAPGCIDRADQQP
jgi:hypothetical protein